MRGSVQAPASFLGIPKARSPPRQTLAPTSAFFTLPVAGASTILIGPNTPHRAQRYSHRRKRRRHQITVVSRARRLPSSSTPYNTFIPTSESPRTTPRITVHSSQASPSRKFCPLISSDNLRPRPARYLQRLHKTPRADHGLCLSRPFPYKPLSEAYP